MEEHEYRYKYWEQAILEKTPFDSIKVDDVDEASVRNGLKIYHQCAEPDLSQFVDHQLQQLAEANARGVDDQDGRWRELNRTTNKARKALVTGDPLLMALAFLRLGEAVGRFRYPPNQWVTDGLLARNEKAKREGPLLERNRKKALLKEYAVGVARMGWEDHSSQVRIGAMCEVIWPHLIDLAKKHDVIDLLPNDAQKLKPWIRDVAPSWAKKGGPPKKSKK